MKTYIVYHGGCWDGLVAAWVARNALSNSDSNLVFIPVQYDQPAPELEGPCNLYLLDFCYPLEQMLRWWQRKEGSDSYIHRMVVIDHHKTAQPIIKELQDRQVRDRFHTIIFGPRLAIFSIDKSAGRLAWEHFVGTVTSPGIVDYTEDRDLWTWKLPGSREVNACLRSYPLAFQTLYQFGGLTYQQLYMEMFNPGAAILRHQQQIIDQHVRFARPRKLLGHDNIPVVNATTLTSDILEVLARGKPFAASYFDSADGKQVWSLRSDENGVDVAELAKTVGGGGHKHAAGFSKELAVGFDM